MKTRNKIKNTLVSLWYSTIFYNKIRERSSTYAFKR